MRHDPATRDFQQPETNIKMSSTAGNAGSEELTVLLWGKTGVGKSETGNTILGRKAFRTAISPKSVTTKCSRETAEVKGTPLVVVDTPGLFHTGMDKRSLMAALLECIQLVRPGPHVILVVVQLGEFTAEDEKVLAAFKEGFSDASRHTLVLFTHGDVKRCKAEEFIKAHKALDTFIHEHSVGFHVFNNSRNFTNIPDNVHLQVQDLLEKMKDVVKENKEKMSEYYSNELFQGALEALSEVEAVQKPPAELSKAEKTQIVALDWLEKEVPGFPLVRSFLARLEKWAMKLMPK